MELAHGVFFYSKQFDARMSKIRLASNWEVGNWGTKE